MKAVRPTAIVLMVGLCLFAACSETPTTTKMSSNTDYIIGLSPFLATEHRDETFRGILNFLVNDATTGSTITVYDAYSLQTICRIEIPDRSVFRSPKTRLNQFKEQFGKLKDFLATQTPPPNEDANWSDAIRLPQFLDFVTPKLRSSKTPQKIFLVGSPLHLDTDENTFSMRADYVPTDGHLLANAAPRVFATSGKEESLNGLQVNQVWFERPWVNDLHREKIHRFWALYLQKRGAILSHFSGDFATALHELPQDSYHVPDYDIDESDKRIQMVRTVRESGVDDWITRDNVIAASASPSVLVGPMKIGIRWDDAVDLDLYARSSPDTPTLYFQNPEHASGMFHRDHRTSSDSEYEFIEFKLPVDRRHAEAWVNLYEGSSEETISGEARIEFAGNIYAKRFTLPAGHGNRGKAGDGQSAFWTKLDIPGILDTP